MIDLVQLQLPAPYLFQIDTPLLLFNGRLLQPKSLTDALDNYAEFYEKRFSLEEIVTPKRLEELYFRHNKAAVEQMQETFIQRYFQQEFRSRDYISENLRMNKTLALIVEKVLPVLTADRLEGKIESIMAEDAQPQTCNQPPQAQRQVTEIEVPESVMREMRAVQRRLIHQVEQEYTGISLEDRPAESAVETRVQELLRPTIGHSVADTFTRLYEGSVLEELLGNNNIMLINGDAYSLVSAKDFISYFEEGLSRGFRDRIGQFPATTDPRKIAEFVEANRRGVDHRYKSRIINKLNSSRLRINRKFYIPIRWGKSEDLAQKYGQLLEKTMKIHAIEHNEYQTQQLYRIDQQRKRLEDIARSTSYERNNAGFMRHGNDYYVYLITPPFAMASPHLSASDRYLEFPPAKIGVRVKYIDRGSGTFEVQEPVVMNSYRHPFVGSEQPFTGICLGSWSGASQDILYNKPPEEKILTYLAQAKKTLMMGYRTGGNPYPRNKLLRCNWDGWKTLQQIEAKGLVCLNDYRRSSR